MIEFRVTGETAEEFAKNATQAYAVLAFGLQKVLPELAAAASKTPTAPASPGPVAAPPAAVSVPTSTAQSESVPTMEPLENPKAGQPVPKTKPEEIKSRLAEVITAAAARGWAPARRNAYAKQLLSQVGASKVTDIDTDEKRAVFMANSASYVAGTVNELDDEIPF